jgi:hypothetical protein
MQPDTNSNARGTPPSHSFRASLFKKERTFRLEPDALVWAGDGGKPVRIAYGDIASAHIYSQPPYRGQAVRRTVLRGKFPGKLLIQAQHFAGFGNVEDRSESYFPFVEELLRRTKAANPGLAIRVGTPWPLYIFWLVLFVIFIAMIPLMLAILFDSGGNLEALGGLLIVAAALPMTWRIVRRGRPRLADADALYSSDIGSPKR